MLSSCVCVCGTRVPQNLSKKCKSISHLTALCTVCVKGQRRRRYDGSRIATCCLGIGGIRVLHIIHTLPCNFLPSVHFTSSAFTLPIGIGQQEMKCASTDRWVLCVCCSFSFVFGGLCQHIKSKIASSLLRKLRSERGRIVNMISVSLNGIAIWHLHLPMQQ